MESRYPTELVTALVGRKELDSRVAPPPLGATRHPTAEASAGPLLDDASPPVCCPNYPGAVTATLDPLAADEVYVAGIEPHPRSVPRRVLDAVLDLWCASFGGLLELSGAADVVVRRRHDGGEELRIYAGPAQHAALVLAETTEDLAASSPQAFRAAWGIG